VKTIPAIIAASVLFSTAAYAGEPLKPARYTDDQINAVLRARGIPPLGSSRVLYDDGSSAAQPKSVQFKTITVKTPPLNVQTTCTSSRWSTQCETTSNR